MNASVAASGVYGNDGRKVPHFFCGSWQTSKKKALDPRVMVDMDCEIFCIMLVNHFVEAQRDTVRTSVLPDIEA